MTTYEAMLARRTIRRFTQQPIDPEILKKAVNVARLAPMGVNAQSLKFVVVTTPALVEGVFDLTKWGAHLKDGSGTPKKPDELPTAWIVIAHDKEIKENPMREDLGAAAENIIIYAQSEGISSCWLQNIKPSEIAALLELPGNLQILACIALGYPAMASREVPIPASGETPYYWGADGVLEVPKRSLDEVMLQR